MQAQGRRTKTHAKANKCLFSGGRELEHGAFSSSYLSLSALALNECSSSLGHITFVLYKSLWTAERYWTSFDHGIRLNFKSDTNTNPPTYTHPTPISSARSSSYFQSLFCLFIQQQRKKKKGARKRMKEIWKRKAGDAGARSMWAV